MPTETQIQTALLDRAVLLAAVLGLPLDTPNKPSSEKPIRLEAKIFRNQPVNFGWGDETIFQGILQIDYITNVQGGSVAAMTICNQIAAFFDKGIQIWNGDLRIVVEEKPAILTEVQEGEKSTWPVSIQYKSRPL